ncbi:UNVERIFIED_CONTAM: hypothetical protein PYX00_002025 [Menopon gallinae]|uniref:Uncharacterized protein n=1 Tax=Menopon gallinae TaxID=328185 RepID=A0AAW2IF09_9NEOP
MSGESDGIQDAVIQDYLNDTDSELSSLSHLDAPNESMYMIGGVLIAMILVGLIIILLAVTIRFTPPSRNFCSRCCLCCGLR